ncbi:MAG: GIY-YIG nuclease family protein [Marinoscillum sp.]
MRAKGGYVYIVSNKGRNVLYIGVTSNLYARIYEHKNGCGSAFTTKYKCIDLMYYQFYNTIMEAIDQEKRMKKWKRAYKDNLITSMNPNWEDLFDQVEEMQ